MAVLKNRAKMSTSTTGTGTITLGSAEDGYQTFADAGVANADVVRYIIEDTGGAFEIGTGTYTSSGTTLSRTVSESSNADAAINLSGSATVFIGATAEDIPALYAANEVSVAAQPSATGDDAIAIGDSATSSGQDAVAIGFNADATNTYSVAIGHNTVASGAYGIALGRSATASSNNAAALGWQATASGTQAVALGTSSTASGNNALAGPNSTASATNSVAIGQSASTSNFGGAAFGKGATTAVNNYNVAIGNSYTSGESSLAAAIDNNTSSYGASGTNSVAIGEQAKASANKSFAFGRNTHSQGQYSVSIGNFATTSTTSAVAIGANASATVTGQVAVAGTGNPVKISGNYTLPTSDGTNGQVMTTNGSGVVTFADAGGGSPDLFAENYDGTSPKPSATGVNAVAIGRNATATQDNNISVGLNCDATGLLASSFGISADSAGGYSTALGYASDTSSLGSYSLAAGASAQTAGTYAVAFPNSYASGNTSLAGAIGNNTSSYGATGANSIAMGKNAKATNTGGVAIGENNIAQGDLNASAIGGKGNTASGYYAIASGGQNNSVTGARSAILAGSSNTVSGSNSVILGGGSNTASGQHCFIFGQNSTASENYTIATGYFSKAATIGKKAHASGSFSAAGDAQGGQFILRADTTDATATVLTTTNSTASTDNQIIAASDTCIMFSGTIVAMQNGAQDQGGWEIKGLLKNDGGTTTLVSSNIQTFADGNGWVVALTADNTNNALAITCTGEAAHNIRWVANIQTSEVTYA